MGSQVHAGRGWAVNKLGDEADAARKVPTPTGRRLLFQVFGGNLRITEAGS